MASKKGVSKEDLKRLMKKMKTDGTIKHPLAKYNSLGHLICTVCNCQIKSDRLWSPHLLSRSHKENTAQPKKNLTDLQTALSNKRKSSSCSSDVAKKHKGSGSPCHDSSRSHPGKPKSILKNSLPLAGYASSSDESIGDVEPETITDILPSSTSGLPADFFDSGSAAPAERDGEEAMDSGPTDELPEGFFDDPKADAKARNVEYVDKEEQEWDKFQSEMKQEAQISEQIEAEDDAVNTGERHLEEIDEQLVQWSRVNEMVLQKTELMKQKTMETGEESKDSVSDTEDLEYEEFLDWRTKKIIK